jgi:hypothetical protein
MSTGTTKAPNLPIAPVEYSQQYQDQLNNVLRLYFSQLDNPGPSAMATQRNTPATGNATVISALNFSQANATGIQVLSLPTQVELSKLRVGDVYVDTANANVLKVKVS